MRNMKDVFRRVSAFLLAVVLLMSNSFSVSATSVADDTQKYTSHSYTVNGFVAYAFNGASISGDDYTLTEMSNASLSKALYFSYGAKGYADHYQTIDEVYKSHGATKDTDKLAISEMILTNIYNGTSNDMVRDFQNAIGSLSVGGDYVPYLIVAGDGSVVGCTFTASAPVNTPKNTISVSTEEEPVITEGNEDDEDLLNAKGDKNSDGYYAGTGRHTWEKPENFTDISSSIDTMTMDKVNALVNSNPAYYSYNHHAVSTGNGGAFSRTSTTVVFPSGIGELKIAFTRCVTGSGDAVPSKNKDTDGWGIGTNTYPEYSGPNTVSKTINTVYSTKAKVRAYWWTDGDYAYCSLITPYRPGYQALHGGIKFKFVKDTYISFSKTNTVKNLANADANMKAYSVSGCKYGVYSDSACKTLVNTITIGENGVGTFNDGSTTLKAQIGQKFYILELGSDKKANKYYAMDKNKITVTAKEGYTKANPQKITTTDDVNKYYFFFTKENADKNVKCDEYSLEDAEFELYTTKSCSSSSKANVILGASTDANGKETLVYGSPKFTSDEDGNLHCSVSTSKVTLAQAQAVYKNATLSSSKKNVKFSFDSSTPIRGFLGTYYAKETKAPKGFLLNKTPLKISVGEKNSKSSYAKGSVKDQPLLDPFKFKLVKYDISLDKKIALEGTFTVEYYDGLYNRSEIAGKTPVRTWKFKTKDGEFDFRTSQPIISSSDEFYLNDKNERSIPVGTVVVKETIAPNGYALTSKDGKISINGTELAENDFVLIQFRLNSEGTTMEKFYENKGKFTQTSLGDATITCRMDDAPTRADFQFTKVRWEDGTWKNMKYVPFIIEDTVTGERHIIVSDENGFVTSQSYEKVYVNGNSLLLSHASKSNYKVNGNDKYLNNLTASDVLNDKLRPTGIWFYGTTSAKDIDDDAMKNTSGALIDGHKYLVTEIPTNSTEKTHLISFDFVAGTDNAQNVEGYDKVSKFEQQVDEDFPSFETLSMDNTTNSHKSKVSEATSIQDTVKYKNLAYDKSYTVKGVLVAQNSTTLTDGTKVTKGKPLLDKNGNMILAHQTFRTEKRADSSNLNYYASGEVVLHYNFNSTNLLSKTKGTNVKGVWMTYICGADNKDLVFDANSNVDKEASGVLTEPLAGGKTFWYEDADLNSKSELVEFVGEGPTNLHTEALSNTTKINNCEISTSVSVSDRVFLSGLKDGENYKIVTTLVDPEKYKEGVSKSTYAVKDKDGKDIDITSTLTYDKTQEVNGEYEFDITLPVFDGTPYIGKRLVVFQEVYDKDDNLILDGRNIEDDDETLYFPSMQTTATSSNGKKTIPFYGPVSIQDTVTYTNLIVGKTYTLTGTLHYVDENGKEQTVVNKNDEPITATKTFKASKSNGSEVMTFTFNVSDVKGDFFPQEIVVFEDLEYKGVRLVSHADIKDKNQTVKFAKIQTSIKENETGVQNLDTYKKIITLVDTVSYTNLDKGGRYVLKAKLINSKTGKPIEIDGKEVVAFKRFTASGENGAVDVSITFDGEKVDNLYNDNGKADASLICFETLYEDFSYETATVRSTARTTFVDTYDGVSIVATHTDIDDTKQTISSSSGGTKLMGNGTNSHTVSTITETITLTDTVTYHNLIVGKTYTVSGTLYAPLDQATESEKLLAETDENGIECVPVLDADGRKIVGRKTFTPTEPDGTVEVEFSFESKITKWKKTMVAFENVNEDADGKGRTVFTHADITDKDQTVVYPSVHTTALSEDTQEHFMGAYKTAKIIDTVEFSNIKDGSTIQLKGVLMDKATKKPLLVNDKQVLAETEAFVVSAEDEDVTSEVINGVTYVTGVKDVVFEFDATALAGKELVVFEDLLFDIDGTMMVVAQHKDIEDEGQTVRVTDFKTKAKKSTESEDSGKKNNIQTFVDTVTYTNLIVGKTYTIKGMIMQKPSKKSLLEKLADKIKRKQLEEMVFTYDEEKQIYIDQNGVEVSPLIIDGKPVTSEVTFTATQPNGTIDVTFTFDVSSLVGKEVVVFEDCYNDGIRIGTHADITDKDQTIPFYETPPVNPPTTEETPTTEVVAPPDNPTPPDNPPTTEVTPPTETTPPDTPKTGDNTPVKVIVGMMVVALCGVCGITIAQKRNKKKEDE